jgi:hypothetical protein
MYANIYLAQVDEEKVEPGAKIAGFHTLLYDFVMSSLILMVANLVPLCVFFSYIKCLSSPFGVDVVCEIFFIVF